MRAKVSQQRGTIGSISAALGGKFHFSKLYTSSVKRFFKGAGAHLLGGRCRKDCRGAVHMKAERGDRWTNLKSVFGAKKREPHLSRQERVQCIGNLKSVSKDKMVPRVILLFCCTAVACSSRVEVNFLLDEPSRQVEVGHTVHLKCHYNITGGAVDLHWVIFFNTSMPFIVPLDTRVTLENKTNSSLTLIVRQVTQNDTGLYCCYVNDTKVMNPFSSGTYLQVYEPLKKTINISESAKNRILVAEGILLLLCLIVPGTILISKTKKDSELEKKKSKIEEENIYEGLNLDDCNSAYHQIQRSQVQCPYQDVDNIRDDDIQLEKP